MNAPKLVRAEGLLERALEVEAQADSLCARQDFTEASAALRGALDLLKSRQALLSPSPPFEWYEEWEEGGALAACRLLYKHAGCCLLLGRFADSAQASMDALGLAGWQLDRQGGWGRDPLGPGTAKALYRWGQALHALQHLASACPDAARQQAAALRSAATAADGRLLADVQLPVAGTLPTPAAADALEYQVGAAVLCSSPELEQSAAGFIMQGRAGRCVQLDSWHATRAHAAAPPPTLPTHSFHVPLCMLPDADEQQRRYLQPLPPLLAAYMSQRWQQEPIADLPAEDEEEACDDAGSPTSPVFVG